MTQYLTKICYLFVTIAIIVVCPYFNPVPFQHPSSCNINMQFRIHIMTSALYS